MERGAGGLDLVAGRGFRRETRQTGEEMKIRTLAAAAAVLAVSARAAGAQVLTPTFLAPRVSSDLGVYVSDGPGSLAIEGIWRRPLSGGAGLGLRAGFADASNGSALLLGVDYRNPLSLAGTAPVDLALTLGAQAALGDVQGIGAQVGLSVGYTFTAPEVTVTPYIHPLLTYVNVETGPDDGGEVEPRAEVGLDVGFAPNLSLRFGANLGDGADWGIGLAWRTR